MLYFRLINLLLAGCLFSSTLVNAQNFCVDFSATTDDSLAPIENLWIGLISKSDTVIGLKSEGRFCFNTKTFSDQPIDILIGLPGTKLQYRSLYPAFLKMSDQEPKWVLRIDKRPFDRKKYPRIKEWRGVEVIEVLEVSSKNGEDAVIFYKRKKDGTYLD